MTTLTRPGTLPGTLGLGLARGGIELRQFFRQREAVVFTFSLPAFLLVLLGSIFDESYPGTDISSSELFAAGMVGAGIISTSFVSMGTSVGMDRDDGTLKRLRGTPMPLPAYFIGKTVLVAVSSLAQAALMITIGVLLMGLELPGDPAKWLTFAWLFVLGITSCALLGIAVSAFSSSVNGAVASTNLIQLALQFTSGVFVTPIVSLPAIMVTLSSFFPVKWICQGFRSVFLPEEAARYEMAGQWELGKTALVLGGWTLAGLVLCLLVFRRLNRRS